MTITLVQYNIKWNDAIANQNVVAEMLKGIQTDLIILPEMWNTGFITDPQKDNVVGHGESLVFMQKEAKELDAAIVGSMAIEDKGKHYNRLYFVRPDGSYDTYDKHHLFIGENANYTAGKEPLIIEWRGVRIMLLICYDLRFPVFSRNRLVSPHKGGAGGGLYDLCIYIASWPESRRMVWDTLLRARALENQCYVAGVNRIGDDASGIIYNGGTQLIDAYGKIVAMAEDNKTSIITEILDMERLQSFRKKFPVLNDAD